MFPAPVPPSLPAPSSLLPPPPPALSLSLHSLPSPLGLMTSQAPATFTASK